MLWVTAPLKKFDSWYTEHLLTQFNHLQTCTNNFGLPFFYMLKSSYICFYNLQLGHPGYIMVFHVQAAWFCHVCESSIHKHAFFFKITVINEQAKWTSPASEMWSQAQRSKGNAKNQVKKHRGDASSVGQCRSLVHLICILAVSPNALTHLDLVGPSGLDVGA